MRKFESRAIIFIVVLLVGILVFWMIAVRDSEIDLALQRLIQAGYSVDEILQDSDFTRLASEKDGLPTNPDEWTQDDIHWAMRLISESAKKLGASPAANQVRRDAVRRQIDYLGKKIAVQVVIIAAQETHREGPEPFTFENSLPASVRTKVDEAFGDDADAVLLQIEEAFADRVIESHGGTEGFINHLLESQSAAADE